MGEIAVLARQEVVEPLVRIVEGHADGHTLAPESRRRQRDEKALDRNSARGEIAEAPIDDVSAREAEALEARRSETGANPTLGGGMGGDAPACQRAGP